tara:strand:- start:50 stop:403 length:354 start_codon:yes stop_codon:yes gene_type:complete
MENKTNTNNQLGSILAQIIEKCFNNYGFIPNVNQTLRNKYDRNCLILSNKVSGKVALVGNMVDAKGSYFVNAFLIDVWKWNWASAEGFCIDDIFKNRKLYDEVFTMVPAKSLPMLLA